jgi:hypothetical protein
MHYQEWIMPVESMIPRQTRRFAEPLSFKLSLRRPQRNGFKRDKETQDERRQPIVRERMIFRACFL